jgi:HAD superfamily hydrolase (TIGR01490 family)
VTDHSRVTTRIAAFFDLDGTLTAEPSLEVRFFRSLSQHNAIPPGNYLRWAAEAARLFPRGFIEIRHANKQYLRGIHREMILCCAPEIHIFDEALARLTWHARQGHDLVLLTGTLEPLAYLAATAIECELEARGLRSPLYVCATRLEEKFGRWTGRLAGKAMYGPAKREMMLHFARHRGIDLHNSYAYGNTVLDCYMLSAVGFAHVVNPGKQLATVANLYNWPVWHWSADKLLPALPSSDSPPTIQPLESGV